MCCWANSLERTDVTTPIFTWQERYVIDDRAGTGMILREDSCGSWWPLGRDWVTGQVPGENFWILHRSYWLWILWIGCKMRWVWRETFALENEGKEQVHINIFLQFDLSHNFLISIRTRNFCSSLNCLKDGSGNNKKHLSSSTSVSSIFCVAKYAVVTPRRKFRLASFFEYFEIFPLLLLFFFFLRTLRFLFILISLST